MNTLKGILYFLLVSVELGFAQGLSQQLDVNSVVDWQRLVIRSSGNSAIALQRSSGSERVEALEKAKMSAEENLFKAAQLLPLTADLTVGKTSEEVLAKLRQITKKFTIVDTRSMSDMTLEVDVELPFTGEFASMLIPEDTVRRELMLGQDPLCPTCGQAWPQGRPIPEGVQLIIPSEGYVAANGQPFSGLIVDASDLDVSPALLPKIVNEDGSEIYGINYIDKEIAIEAGIVAYTNGLDEARNNPRVGASPLEVRAVSGSGKTKANIVVSNHDAILIHAAARKNDFLKDCKVIVII